MKYLLVLKATIFPAVSSLTFPALLTYGFYGVDMFQPLFFQVLALGGCYAGILVQIEIDKRDPTKKEKSIRKISLWSAFFISQVAGYFAANVQWDAWSWTAPLGDHAIAISAGFVSRWLPDLISFVYGYLKRKNGAR